MWLFMIVALLAVVLLEVTATSYYTIDGTEAYTWAK
jgi:hypothetical protein